MQLTEPAVTLSPLSIVTVVVTGHLALDYVDCLPYKVL